MDKSLLDIARDYLLTCDKPQNMENIYAAVQAEAGLSDDEFMEVKAQFYTDFTLCSYFIYCGKGDWDIKSRQSIDLFDCDSSFFLDPNERKELQEARRKKAKKEISVEDNDAIAGYEGVDEYVEIDDEEDSYDDQDADDLLMNDHYDEEYDDDDDDDDYYDLDDQYDDLYEN